jgi:hypothetical protein
MRKLPLSLLAAGAFTLAYAAGAYGGVCAARRQARRRRRAARAPAGREQMYEAAPARYELAAIWARQAMFGSA